MPALAQNPPATFWNKYNGTYDTGRNFLKNLGRGSGAVSGNQGAYTFSWPIPLPAGRRGVQPSLSLMYSSRGGRSYLGEGWSMPMPHIARSTNFGTPSYSYDDQDIFEFHDASGKSHPMVPVEDLGDEIRYRFLRESAFSIARRDLTADTWTILRRDGHVLRFGDPITYRARVNISELGTFAWYQHEHEDTMGNKAHTYYQATTGPTNIKVPQTIYYTKGDGINPAPIRVDFSWQTNANKKFSNCKPGRCAYIDELILEKIEVFSREEYSPGQVDYVKRREIDFSDSYDEIDGHRVLVKISQTAYRIDGTPDTIPDVEFEYENTDAPGMGYSSTPLDDGAGPGGCTPEVSDYEFDKNNDFWWTSTLRTLADMNGDGIKDLVMSTNIQNEYGIYFGYVDSQGNFGFDESPQYWDPPINSWRNSNNIRTMSSDQDDGSGAQTNTQLLQDLVDMNGDGRADWVERHADGPKVALNNGSGFDSKITWPGPGAMYLRDSNKRTELRGYFNHVVDRTNYSLMDLNGDGLPDLYPWFNDPNKEGQFIHEAWDWQCDNEFGIVEVRVEVPDKQPGVIYTLNELRDINGDGLPDIVFQPDTIYPFDLENLRVCYNSGHGWESSVSLGTAKHVGVSRDTTWEQNQRELLVQSAEELEGFSLEGQGEQSGHPDLLETEAKDPPPLPREEWAAALFMDWTGDGLADYLYWDDAGQWRMRRNTGEGFSSTAEIISTLNEKDLGLSYTFSRWGGGTIPDRIESVVKHMDLDGDGGLDMVWGNENCQSSTNLDFYIGSRPHTFKLLKVINNFGAEVNIEYMPANRTENAQIPMPMSVVTQVQSSEQITGRNHSLTYLYGDGLYDGQSVYVGPPPIFKSPGNRAFRGFGWIQITDSARNTTSESEYHQDVYKAGKPIYTRVVGPQGDLPLADKASAGDRGSVSQTTSQELTSVTPDGVTPLHRSQFIHWPTPQFTYAHLKKKISCLGSECTTTGKRYTYDTGHGRMLTKIDAGICSNSECTNTRYTHKTTITYKELLNYNINRWLVKKKQETLSQNLLQFFTWTWIQQAKQIFYHDSIGSSSILTEGLLRRVLRYNSSIKGDIGSSIKNYDSRGMLVSETDYNTDNPVLTSYVLDPYHGKYVTSKTTAGLTETQAWDYGLGQKVLSIDPNGVESGWVHDGFGRVLQEQWRPYSSADWQVLTHNYYTDFAYRYHGTPVYDTQWTTVDEGENLFSLTMRFYDGTGRLLQEAARFDGNNAYTRRVAYDGTGRINCVTKPRLESETSATTYQGLLDCESCTDCSDYGFDGLDRVRWTREAVNNGQAARAFTYGGDLSVSMTDEEGKELKTLSDGWGNIKSVIRDPNGLAQTSTYYYNAGNRIRLVKDPENNYISYVRNYLGNITQVNLPNSHQWNFAHDDNGNTIYSQSPENREIDIQYDDLQRVVLRTFTQDNVVEGSNSYTFDSAPEYGLGRLHMADSEAGQAIYEYEARGKVKRYEFNNATTQSTYVLNYEFNDAGSTKEITYPDGAIYQYEFFPDGSPERLHQASHVIAQRSVYIDPADGLETTELLLENGTMSRRTKRDDSGRLLSLLSETVSPQAPIMERNLNYYTNGKIQQIIDVETSRTSNYGYDSLMRLSEWSDDQYQQFETYSFLNGGTPNQKLQSVLGTMTDLNFSYGDSDFPWAVTQIVDNQAQSTKTLSYDEDGIVHVQSVNGYNTTHTYNAQGLVKQVSQLFSNRQWKYNHEGATATIQATTGSWPFITTTTELVGNLYERFDNSYFTTDYRYHFFGAQRIARTIVANNDISYYHADERGSVRYVTDDQGTITANFDYKPYGDEFTSSGSSTFRFNDRRDEGYDQLRFPLRMLNKTTYHWTALDPKVLTQPSVLLSDGANPFSYCMYDPMNRTDADGGGGVPWGMLWEIMKGMDDSEKEAVAMDRLTDLAFSAAIQTLGEAAANFAVGVVDSTLATVDALSSYDQSFQRDVIHIQLCLVLGVSFTPESTGQMLLRLSGSLAPSAVLGMTLLRPSVLSGASNVSKVSQGSPKLLGPGTKTSQKIAKQMKSRGWTKASVQRTIDKPKRIVNVRDTRHIKGGGRMSGSAKAYVNSKGAYVIRNEQTGEIVQISNKYDPNWAQPF